MTLIPIPQETPAWVAEMLEKMITPSIEQAGQLGGDLIKYVRGRLQLRFFEKFRKACEDAHINIKQVNLPLLFDILQRGTIEEDDSLQAMWANLLANAADAKSQTLVKRAFPEILRQLSSEEAIFLGAAYEIVGEQYKSVSLESQNQLPSLHHVERGNLIRLGLIGTDHIRVNGVGSGTWLTYYGYEFVKACCAPASLIKTSTI